MSTSINYSFDFSGRIVLITGGSNGIGLATAAAFARAGATVVITGRDQERLDKAAGQMPSGRVEAVRADVAVPADIQRLVHGIIERHGRLDAVVSNAAAYVPGEITDVSARQWEHLRQTNVDGFFHLAKATLPLLAETGGTFTATSSVSGLSGDWKGSVYNASKGAVSQFVRALALDWGSRGVRVNAVAPSLTRTDAVAAVTANRELTAKFEERVALGRLGEPEDVASVFLFLASEAARYVTGVVLPVDGGTTASSGQARV
ncbi:SDR family NAD(P)-dependent oxidoreductase [Streptomyces galbus]|uniref:SDR family oxidoreductase n=1 Tax=Streptomyces galbus TaxID=33898 RepID=A0A4U5X095_STRGB|nr:SDR family oxidoreductase [Streptomyces galbus]TKT08050.1 SDR family oxidoreductase [Streptomyces galbus]GHD42433.1 3-oxoacyl-ACP reductase [Streptomyces galbus]